MFSLFRKNKQLRLPELVNELHNFLQASRHYFIDDDKAESINLEILESWRYKIEEAVEKDFKLYLPKFQIEISNIKFNIFSDQGACKLICKTTLIDIQKSEKLNIVIEAIVNYQKIVAYLGSEFANELAYNEKSKEIEKVFLKLKIADKNVGHFNPISYQSLMLN
ncbi:MAG: hypothetical protein ACXWEY_11290 [Bacteroidia bacterium]